MKLIDKLYAMSEKHKPLSSGFYAYHTPHGVTPQYRLHLRIEPDGEGVLIVNASSILHLNQTATEMVLNLIQGKTDQENAKDIAKRFKVDNQTSLQDVATLHQQLDTLLNTVDLNPEVQNLFEPHLNVDYVSAPYRLDCYLADFSAQSQPLLTLEQWKSMLQKAFNAGIPHIVFCGAEPTEITWLRELVAYTEELGLVTGLVSQGPKLADPGYINELIDAGLDHLMVIYDPENEVIREALGIVLPLDLYTTVGLIVRAGDDHDQRFKWLDSLGANAYALIAHEEADIPTMQQLADDLAESNHHLVYDLPFPKDFHESIEARVDEAGEARYIDLSVAPSGEVFADNSWAESLGNLLENEFKVIWSNRNLAV